MAKSLVIAEQANLAALMDRGRAIEFFFENDGFTIGDIYSARVENILPSIDAVFVSLGNSEKMGFLHASDLKGSGPLADRVFPKQKILVQVVKEPTGNKGPRVSTEISLLGRFFVLTTEHENIMMSRRISSPDERARLKSIASLLKPPVGFGLVIRTEAMGATEHELEEDFRELFFERWKYILDQMEISRRPGLIIRDSKNLLYRVLRDVFHDGVQSVAVDNQAAADKAQYYLNLWSHNPPQVQVMPVAQLFQEYGVASELKAVLSPRIELPSGGYLLIQPTEALTVIDVNSGKFTSSSTPAETILHTNLEAGTEVARQLRLRNIGGVIVIDFIDMDNKFDRLKLLEHFEKLLDSDPARPQIGRLSDLGLVELTRHRQEKNVSEALGHQCTHCHGIGRQFPILDLIENNKIDQMSSFIIPAPPPLANVEDSPTQQERPEQQDEQSQTEGSGGRFGSPRHQRDRDDRGRRDRGGRGDRRDRGGRYQDRGGGRGGFRSGNQLENQLIGSGTKDEGHSTGESDDLPATIVPEAKPSFMSLMPLASEQNSHTQDSSHADLRQVDSPNEQNFDAIKQNQENHDQEQAESPESALPNTEPLETYPTPSIEIERPAGEVMPGIFKFNS
ncbi:MAG: Rne/Rng family ribonuclease [Candidatus Caenarcaniphilales bacterium]|nr:Rne/Rng family ribonuclease [Candidatus Caenarcaniphilales bacterium]